MPEGEFGLWISMLNRAAQSYFTRELGAYGVGPGQQAYLLALAPGEVIHQDELARRLRVDKANVTRAIAGLASLGYINQERSSEDARIKLISLTPAGEPVRRQIETASRRWLDRLKAAVTEEEWAAAESALRNIALSLDET